MTRIMPVFKDDDDRIITIAVLLTSFFFLFIPSSFRFSSYLSYSASAEKATKKKIRYEHFTKTTHLTAIMEA